MIAFKMYETAIPVETRQQYKKDIKQWKDISMAMNQLNLN